MCGDTPINDLTHIIMCGDTPISDLTHIIMCGDTPINDLTHIIMCGDTPISDLTHIIMCGDTPIQKLLYSRKHSREKLVRIGEKHDFDGENLHGLLTFAVPKNTTAPNFADKTFTNSHKTAKFVKVFLLKFPTIR